METDFCLDGANQDMADLKPLGDYILLGMKYLYEAQQLCDVTLAVEQKRFHCHRVFLASVSSYFQAMFTSCMAESRASEVHLKEVLPEAVEHVLKFVYTAQVELSPETAEDLYTVAYRLQVLPLQHLCSRYLISKLTLDNCLGIYNLALIHNDTALLRAALRIISQNLQLVCLQEEFLHLDLRTLVNIISADGLLVSAELEVFRAAKRWADFQPEERYPIFSEVALHFRLSLLTHTEMKEIKNEICHSMKCEETIRRIHELQNIEVRPRETMRLRMGMFDEKIVCVDLQVREDPNLNDCEFKIDCFDPVLEKWETIQALKSLMHPGCVAIEDKLFVAGGQHKDNSISNTLHEYDPLDNCWIQHPSMSVARTMHGFLAFNQKLYALGGCNETAFLDSVECFDMKKQTWALVDKLPLPLRAFSCAVFRSKLYIIGGTTLKRNHAVVHNNVLIYNVSLSSWNQVPLESHCSILAGAVAIDSGIAVIGGYAKDSVNFQYSSLLDTELSNACRECVFLDESGRVSRQIRVPQLPRRIAAAGIVCWKNRIYVLGGENVDTFYNTVRYWIPGDLYWSLSKKRLPVPYSGVSRFGCASLKFPQSKILSLFGGKELNLSQTDTATKVLQSDSK
ncbi:kelch-like protein 24 [Protopterus annectens]|uniref:kelch-like protein 24 n=1 Tax=Protopterus annectens TaxID=7888 RepID=UPI001CFAF145|nr:kelch-like protein 24 [Protopterus annectens]